MEESSAECCSPPWLLLPHETMAKIFGHLPARDLVCCRLVCSSWYGQTKNVTLWRALLGRDFKVSRRTLFDCSNVENEYRRLYFDTPCVPVQSLKEHTDEVLHVAIAPSGNRAATCSKDNLVVTWRIEETATGSVTVEKLSTFDCAEFDCIYPQWSCFNSDSRLLLVMAVVSKQGRGRIAVLDSATLQVHYVGEMFPFDLYGSWLTNTHVLSAQERFYGYDQLREDSECVISGVNALSGQQAVICHFTGTQAAYIRCLCLSHCAIDTQGCVTGLPLCETLQNNGAQPLSNRLLLYTMGCKSYVPHCIGCAVIEGGIVQRMLIETDPNSDIDVTDTDVNDKAVCRKHLNSVEMNGHVVGMVLSPDGCRLFANVRRWLSPWQPGNSYWDSSPPLDDNIELRVLSVPDFHCLHIFRGHEAYTPRDSCFFIFCDATDRLVASGAEDKHVHIWDRHHNARIAKLSGHTDVVSSVAFSPTQPQLLLSAADDHTLRVWVSRSLARSG